MLLQRRRGRVSFVFSFFCVFRSQHKKEGVEREREKWRKEEQRGLGTQEGNFGFHFFKNATFVGSKKKFSSVCVLRCEFVCRVLCSCVVMSLFVCRGCEVFSKREKIVAPKSEGKEALLLLSSVFHLLSSVSVSFSTFSCSECWRANRVPRRGRLQWARRLPGCTTACCAAC